MCNEISDTVAVGPCVEGHTFSPSVLQSKLVVRSGQVHRLHALRSGVKWFVYLHVYHVYNGPVQQADFCSLNDYINYYHNFCKAWKFSSHHFCTWF